MAMGADEAASRFPRTGRGNKKTAGGVQDAIPVQLPCMQDTDQLYGGSAIAVDPVNRLFLVTENDNACNNGNGSAIIVHDESGNYVETISGFQFPTNVVISPPPALNPSKRMAWAFGSPNGGVSQLQQFYY